MLPSPDAPEDLKDRLLTETEYAVEQVAETTGTRGLSEYGGSGDWWNRLYRGDNLAAMAHLIADEGLACEVQLVYVDPPYAADHAFESRGGGRDDPTYRDSFEDAEYVRFLRERLVLLHELLADDGAIYVHIGEEMMAHVKLLLDEVFGSDNFRNLISRRKCHSKNATTNRFGNVQDFVLFYGKSDEMTFTRPERPPNEREKERFMREYRYTEEETGRRYMKVPIHAPGERDGETGEPWRGMEPPEGKHWTYPPDTLDELDEAGKIAWSSNGNPRKKVYYDEKGGVPVTDMWLDTRDYYNQQQSITGYPTEKNEDLLERIVEASSEPEDLVLDAFVGSGTTAAVADRLGRRWIGIDQGAEAFDIARERIAGLDDNSPFRAFKVD